MVGKIEPLNSVPPFRQKHSNDAVRKVFKKLQVKSRGWYVLLFWLSPSYAGGFLSANPPSLPQTSRVMYDYSFFNVLPDPGQLRVKRQRCTKADVDNGCYCALVYLCFQGRTINRLVTGKLSRVQIRFVSLLIQAVWLWDTAVSMGGPYTHTLTPTYILLCIKVTFWRKKKN